MERDEYLKSVYDVVDLVRCALNGTVPDPALIDALDHNLLMEVAQLHMLGALTVYALESAGVKNKAYHEEVLLRAKKKAVVLINERKIVYDALEKAGIWYVPLKGAVLADMYPAFGVREMADTDILFDEKYTDDVTKIMESLGYEIKSLGRVNHDVYIKPPVFEFEMHRSLVIASEGPVIFDFFERMKDRRISDGGCRYHFSNEDFYLFMIFHEYKHYIRGGTGLRSLADVYVFLKTLGDSLDFDFIRESCRTMGIDDFEERNRRVAMTVFGGGELTDKDDLHFYGRILTSGAFGHIGHMVTGRMETLKGQKNGKILYLKERLFMPRNIVKEVYPFFYRHKFLYPVLIFYRLGRSVTVCRARIASELRILMHYKTKND